MKKATILNEAKGELLVAMNYYDERHFGLGLDFESEVKSSITFIRQFPETFARGDDVTRRCFIKRFPYVIVYLYHDNRVWVIAIAHCKRKPGYWKQRIEKVG
jgi:hypothetical protein